MKERSKRLPGESYYCHHMVGKVGVATRATWGSAHEKETRRMAPTSGCALLRVVWLWHVYSLLDKAGGPFCSMRCS